MKCFFSIIIVLLYLSAFGAGPNFEASKKERFTQYVAGIKYLEVANTLSQEEKVAYYSKLVELTGFSSVLAKKYCDLYADKPGKWVKIIESVITLLNEPIETEEKE